MKTFTSLAFGWLAVLTLALGTARATHIRAGEVTARRISETSLTYEFTITTYTDVVNGFQANQQETDLNICFGDGTSEQLAPRFPTPQTITPIGNETARNVYKIVHTFNAPGTYTVSAGTENRNAGTLNVGRADSDQISWLVETTLLINPTLGQNTTPVLLNPGVDFTAVVGQRFIHNPGAFDAEGDSLSYRLTISKQFPRGGSVCRGFDIPGYKFPQDVCAGQNEALTGPATFGIDPITGDLIWDAPKCVGQYNVAFVVEEWRNGIKIGEVTRDMQIIVKPTDNKGPRLVAPPEICVEAGTLIQRIITATDQPNTLNRKDPLTLTAISGVFGRDTGQIARPYATFTTGTQPQTAEPATGVFTWQTSCAHVRQQAYDVLFKVEDNPGAVLPKLVDSKIFRIRVVAPRPKNLRVTSTPGARSFVLNWDAYTNCPVPAGVRMVIYRREGACDNGTTDLCITTPPLGYIEVGRVGINETTFTDTNNGRGFQLGSQYSYRIQVRYPEPGQGGGGGGSAATNAICVNLPRRVPYITNVTVDRTDPAQGEITVRWTRPFGFDPSRGGAPFEYRVLRTTGLTGNPSTSVARIPTNLSTNTADTVFTDRGLNTTANAYRYKIVVYYTLNNVLAPLDSTGAASSVRLATQPATRSINLTWQANVPWNNGNQRHRVFRETPGQPGTFNQIADVAVTDAGSFRYTDDGTDRFAADGTNSIQLVGDQLYCYRVQTVGTYGIPQVPGLLLNFSQVICASPIDTTRPCPPVLTLDLLNCDQYLSGPCEEPPFNNKLTWTNPATNPTNNEACDKNIVRYNIYYKRYADDEKFTKIDSVSTPVPPAQAYTHGNLTSYAGCYYVTAINRFGNESRPSNIVCKDNCPAYMLPNVFTPNNDGSNDTFQPMNCPRFVNSVVFTVYNRWGVKVYEFSGGPLLTWAGVTTDGKELPAGLYYYQAEVRFDRLNRNEEAQTYKGWIQLLR
ncbi:MAG: gliding motility-associated C-terminal domain-containing protein [Cytophagaceae bacterium]|nr:gliding motility-associated C-terminal domain-containing protein [Cytophagaceae bacterium]